MRKSKFTESQIVATLKQVEGGRQVKDVCRELGISEATYYVWKSKYGGMEASDVQRLRDIEAEHAKARRKLVFCDPQGSNPWLHTEQHERALPFRLTVPAAWGRALQGPPG